MYAAHLILLREWLKRDFRVRYTQTSLGAIWALLQPITLTLTFFFLFRKVGKVATPAPYTSFVLPAMLLWTVLTSGVNVAIGSISGTLYIATKANYPRVVSPLSAVLLPVVDLAVGLLLLPLLFLYQHAHGRFHPLPFLLGLTGCLLLSAAVGVFMSAISLFVRDVRNLLPLLLQAWFILTPIAYPASRLPSVFSGNPMATFIEGFRSSLLVLPGPGAGEWVRSLLIALALCVLALAYFSRVEGRFADVG